MQQDLYYMTHSEIESFSFLVLALAYFGPTILTLIFSSPLAFHHLKSRFSVPISFFFCIFCKDMHSVRSDMWTRTLFRFLCAEARAPQGCPGSLYKNSSSARGPRASSEVCVSYRLNLKAFSNDHNSTASGTTRSLKARCQLMTKGISCS